MNTMVSFNSKYDNWQAGTVQLTDSEERGRNLFFNDKNVQTGMKGAGCFIAMEDLNSPITILPITDLIMTTNL